MKSNGTEFGFVGGSRGALTGEILVVPLLAQPQPPMELVARVDQHCDDAVSELLSAQVLREDVGQLLHTTRRSGCRRVLVVGLGHSDKVGAAEIRQAAAAAARWIVAERLKSATLWIDGLATCGVARASAEWATGMALSGFTFAEYKSSGDKTPGKVRVQVRSSGGGYGTHALAEIREALTLAEAVNYSRRLSHLPGNVINPATLAQEARALGRASGLKCTIFNAQKLAQMKMNGLLAVGQGANHPSCLIQLEYRGAPDARARTVLVGKAVTFDAGGYSIKPSSGMEDMKYDKCGGTAVLGVLKGRGGAQAQVQPGGIDTSG